MTTTAREIIKTLPLKRQQQIKKRAKELIAQEMSLRELRKALELTQVDISAKLGMNQEAISRLERRPDILISTLSSYIKAIGGKLHLTATFPNQAPIHLTGFEDT